MQYNIPQGVTISQLPGAPDVQGTDMLEIEREGASYSISVDDLIDYLGLDEFAEAVMELLG